MPAPPPSRLLSRPFVLLCVATFFGAHAPNLFIVAPRVLRSYGYDEQQIGTVMGAFSLASLCTMPFVAHLADRFGRRAVLAGGMLVCALGCVAFEHAGSLPALAAARAAQGMGWAGALVGASMVVTELAPPGRLGQAIGIAGILTLVAMAVGPLLGELILSHAPPPWLFRTAAVISLAGAATAAALPGAVADRRGDGREWLFAVFRPGTRQALGATFAVAAGFGAIVGFLADYTALEGLGGIAPFFDAYVAAAILARLTCGGLSDRVGRHPVLLPALAGQALSLVGLAVIGARWHLVPLGLVFGFSHGMYYPALQALIFERSPDALKARAVASSNFAFALGMAVAQLGGGAVAKRAGYPAAFGLMAALGLAGAVLVYWDRSRYGGEATR